MAVSGPIQIATGGNSAASTSLTLTLTAPVSIGDLIVVGHGAGGGSNNMSGVVDDGGNAYTIKANKPAINDGGGVAAAYPGCSIAVAQCTVGMAIGQHITVSVMTSTSFIGAWASKFSGHDPSSPVTAQGSWNSNGLAVTSVECADVDPAANPGDMLVGNLSPQMTPGVVTGTNGTIVGAAGFSTGTVRGAQQLYKTAGGGTGDLTATLGTARAATGCVIVIAAAGGGGPQPDSFGQAISVTGYTRGIGPF